MRLLHVLIAAAALLVVAAAPAAAAPSAYWAAPGGGGEIGTAPLADPGAVDPELYSAWKPAGIVVVGDWLYWTSRTTGDGRALYAAPSDGSGPVQRIAGTCGSPLQLAQAGGWLYASDATSPAIGRLPVAAAGSPAGGYQCGWASLGAGQTARDLWTDGSALYWPTTTGGGAIGALPLATRAPDPDFIEAAGVSAATALTGAGGTLYWTAGNGDIESAPSTAGAQPTQIGSVGAPPIDLTTDGNWLYWSAANGETIGRMAMDGSPVQDPFIEAAKGGSNGIGDIAVDPAANVTIQVVADGGGTVTSQPAGIACPTDCAQAFPLGATVSLEAVPDDGWAFVGWAGSPAVCGGDDTVCEFEADQALTVVAQFSQAPMRTLTVASPGAAGTVTSAPGPIVCPLVCSGSYLQGTVVALSASPAAGYQLTGWTVSPGAQAQCGDVAQPCLVTMGQDALVTPVITPIPPPNPVTLVVAIAGTGGGTVSIPGLGTCTATTGSSCSWSLPSGTMVSLAEQPNATSRFAGWSGEPDPAACPKSSATCSFPLTEDTTVDVTFLRALGPVPSDTEIAVAGDGSVQAAEGGFACSSTCEFPLPPGVPATLIAVPDPGSVFTGWSGDVVGTPGCVATSTDCTFTPGGVPVDLTATFADAPGPSPGPAPGPTPGPTPNPPTPAPTPGSNQDLLEVDKTGTPAGIIYSEPAGIACWPNCSVPVPANTPVTLHASEGKYGDFIGWTGPCRGVELTCSVRVGPSSRVGAMFVLSGVLRLTDYRVRPRAIRVGPRTTAVRRKRVPTLARISYRLSENARVTIRIQRVVKKGRKAKTYTLIRRAGHPGGRPGINVVRFSGRVGKKALRTGRWRVIISATDGTTTTPRLKQPLRILRRR